MEPPSTMTAEATAEDREPSTLRIAEAEDPVEMEDSFDDDSSVSGSTRSSGACGGEDDSLLLDAAAAAAPTDPALAAACALAGDLLRQLTRRDAPSGGEITSEVDGVAVDEIRPSRTQGSTPTEVAGNSSFGSGEGDEPRENFDSDDDSTATEDLLQDLDGPAPAERRGSRGDDRPAAPVKPAHTGSTSAYGRIGHAPLVNLCRRTLEQMQEAAVLRELSPVAYRSTQPPLEGAVPPPPALASTKQQQLPPSKRRHFWSKRRDKNSGTVDSGEEKKDDSSLIDTKKHSRSSIQTPQLRLHQFGSEYARHLSSSRLAPPPGRSKAARMKFRLPKKSNKTKSSSGTMALEEASPDVLTGAIVDICIRTKGDPDPPFGYHKLTQTAGGQLLKLPFDIFLHKEPNWERATQRPAITAVALVFPDLKEFVPPGFCVARNHGAPANIGTADRRCYLVFRRAREGNPLTGLLPLLPPEGIPDGYTALERTPRNHVAALPSPDGGKPLFLAYRQRLSNLEVLRPLPLLATVKPKAGADFTDDADGDYYYGTIGQSLRAYYCTGGTTVSANVGRFHVMDRSTHEMLSPNGVIARQQLIEASRRRATGEATTGGSGLRTPTEATGRCTKTPTGAELSPPFALNDDLASLASAGRVSQYEAAATPASECDRDRQELQQMGLVLKRASVQLTITTSVANQPLLLDPSMAACLEAMSFIPVVESVRPTSPTRLHGRVAVLTPILTACYTRHGGAALLAVEGLGKLLIETDFFLDDIADLELTNVKESSTRLTLLDLAVQTVCDVATGSAIETIFPACVEFVEAAVNLSQGLLSTRSIGFVVRFYLFVFYFGASVPVGKVWKWKTPAVNAGDTAPDKQPDVPLLDDPREGIYHLAYLPGGAPQAAALAFKQLLSLLIARLAQAAIMDQVLLQETSMKNGNVVQERIETVPGTDSFIGDLLGGIVDNAVDHVVMADCIDTAIHQMHGSGGSELFWHDMVNTCGDVLFGKVDDRDRTGRFVYKMVFAVLANLVKQATSKHRRKTQKMRMPRETASRMLSLELILHFLEVWSDQQEAFSGMSHGANVPGERLNHALAYSMRRMVVAALLSNTRCALEDPQIYRRVLRIISEFWCSPIYRLHCKLEIGILIEHFALRILQLGPQFLASNSLDIDSELAEISLYTQQTELLQEIKRWFSLDPKDVIEMYLNYDTDMHEKMQGLVQNMLGTQRKIFQRLCSGLSSIAEQCGEIIGEQIQENHDKIMSQTDAIADPSQPSVSLSLCDRSKLDRSLVHHASRSLRKASLEAISEIVRSLAISAAAGAGPVYCSLLLSWTPFESPVAFERCASFSSPTLTDEQNENTPHSVSRSMDHLSLNPSGQRHAATKGDDDIVKYWRNAYAEERDERLRSAAASNRESVAAALELSHRKSLKKAVEYLIACGILSPAPRDIANFLHIHKDRLDPKSLGLYLSESGVGGKEIEYWNQLRFIYIRFISFAGMTVQESLRHFLTQCGFWLPGEAQKIDRILSTFARCYFQDNAGDSQRCPFKNEDVVYLLSFAIIMLNTDLHKAQQTPRVNTKKMTKSEFINNFRGAECGGDVSKNYLSEVFDEIEAHPIVMHGGDVNERDDGDRIRPLVNMIKNVQTADSLLRGLAVHHFKFATIEDFTETIDYSVQEAVGDLARSCVSKTWNEWYSVVNTGLETAHLDPTGMEPCIDILMYALCCTIILDMPRERGAFLNQLSRLKAFEIRRYGQWVSSNDVEKDEDWFLQLEIACSGSEDRKIWALKNVHEWMLAFKSALRGDVRNKEQMTEAVKELIDGEFLMEDPARSFIRSQNLIKKSIRTGRTAEARFFLFSDVLIYGKEHDGGRFKICEELPLHLIKVIDFFPPTQKNRQLLIEIHHPRKSFQILCPSPEIRRDWVSLIKTASTCEIERKMHVEAARLAVHAVS